MLPEQKLTVNTDEIIKDFSFTADDYYEQINREFSLPQNKLDRFQTQIREEVENWISDIAPIHRKLEEFYALSSGYTLYPEDAPYEGAYVSHIDLYTAFLSVYTAVINRSILGSQNIWYVTIDPEYDQLSEVIADIDIMINYKAINDYGIPSVLKDAFYCASRDGLSAVVVEFIWDERDQDDIVYIYDQTDFQNEFPNPASCGMSIGQYQKFAEDVLNATRKKAPVVVPINYKKIEYMGPKGYLVERANLVTFPATAKSIDREDCRGYGYRFSMQRDEVKRYVKDGVWNKTMGERFLRMTQKGAAAQVNDWERNKNESTGIGYSDTNHSYEFYGLVYYYYDTETNEDIKLRVVYNHAHRVFLSIKKYFYRVDNMALFWVDRRPNQLDGKGVIEKLQDVGDEIDHIHSQRMQSRDITNIPSFKAKKSAKNDFDPLAEENRWHPGVIFWLTDPDAFNQFPVQPVDLGQSLQEEMNDWKIASLLIGIDPFSASGQPMPSNPDAPGNKTAILIQQSNMRMNDPIDDLREGVGKVGEIILSMLYQFGPAEISYFDESDDRRVKKYLMKKYLRAGIKPKMRAISAIDNGDAEFIKGMQRHNMLLQSEPLFAQDPKRRVGDLRNIFTNARFPDRNKLLPSDQEIEMQLQAQVQSQQQQLAAQQEQANQQNQLQMTDQALRSKEMLLRMIDQKQRAEDSHNSSNLKAKDQQLKELMVKTDILNKLKGGNSKNG